jgi:hypothetical protein
MALAMPAVASAARKKSKKPVITRVTPMRLPIGGKLTIRGKNFSSSRRRNTVIFRGPGKRTALVKPRRASRRKLVVVVPSSVGRSLRNRRTARFRLRVLVKRKFSGWTRKRLSPVIVSSRAAREEDPSAPLPPSECDAGDYDGDLLSGTTENNISTDPCLKDTDGDGIEDGYEFRSALDLNDDEDQNPNTSLPYPGKRPYPNPLDPSDANTDFDRDVLTLREEQRLWHYTISRGAARTLNPLSYSDGEQYSVFRRRSDGRREPTLSRVGYSKHQGFLSWASGNGYRNVVLSDGFPWYSGLTQNGYGLLDFNRNGSEDLAPPPGAFRSEVYYYDHRPDGWLSDDERDEDGDGLTNYDETHGRMTLGYWDRCYSQEKPFKVRYAGTNYLDADSDGDGVLDGADDQDHDDIPNLAELSRNAASGLDDRKFGRSCTPDDTVSSANFAVTGGPLPDAALVVTFRNEFGDVDVPQMTATDAGLSGGSISVATVRQGGSGVEEQQTVTISGSPTAGGFTLTFAGQTTPQLAFNATADAVQAALDNLFPAADNSNHPNAFGRVSPFNPCLPATWSRTCEAHPGFEDSGAPFDDSKNWHSLN